MTFSTRAAVAGTGMLLLATLRAPAQAPSSKAAADPAATRTTWRDYGGGADGAQYSALAQINRSNVSTLQVAWTYPTGDAGNYLFNPVVVDDVMYVLARENSIVALDAATGKERWTYTAGPGRISNRGINYWEKQDRSDRRLFFAHEQRLKALDARTGTLIPTFGADGGVDLRAGLDRDPAKLLVQSGTPGRVFENLIILGSATNQEYDSAPGDIRAYDVRSGALVWTFHTVPRPGEFGYDTWPADAWKTVGGANAWAELSVDEDAASSTSPPAVPSTTSMAPIARARTSSATACSRSTRAPASASGISRWCTTTSGTTTTPPAPKLLTVRHPRRADRSTSSRRPGKTGFLYVFDRVTGEPLWPIEERPVPRSDMPGEETWPTQPFPTAPPPFARQTFTEKDLSPYIDDPAERAQFLEDIRSARNEGLFTPPGLRNTIQMPGNNGGSNFSGAAVDPGARDGCSSCPRISRRC